MGEREVHTELVLNPMKAEHFLLLLDRFLKFAELNYANIGIDISEKEGMVEMECGCILLPNYLIPEGGQALSNFVRTADETEITMVEDRVQIKMSFEFYDQVIVK